MALQHTNSTDDITGQYDTADIEVIPSPTLSDFSSVSFTPTDMADDHVVPELFAENGKDPDASLPVSLNSFIPVIERLPGLILEDNTYHIKSPLSSTDLAELTSYCKRIEQLTLTDALYDQYPQVAPNTFARLSRIENPESPLLSSLKHLHLVDANLTLCYLMFCVTPSLESLKISGIPRSQSITISCFLEDLASSVVPGLASITLGPGPLSTSVLKTSLEFTHLRHLHIVDAIASLDFDLLQGVANLPHLESFSIDACTAEYTQRPDSANQASSLNENEPANDQLAIPFPRLAKLAVISNVVLMGDLIHHLFPRAIKDVSLTMVRTGPLQMPLICDQWWAQSNAVVPGTAPPVAEEHQTFSTAGAEHLPEPVLANGMVSESILEHQTTGQSIMATLKRIVQDVGLQPTPKMAGKKKKSAKRPQPLTDRYRSAAQWVAEAEREVVEIATVPDRVDVSNISDSKIVRRLKANARLTEAILALAKIEVERIHTMTDEYLREPAQQEPGDTSQDLLSDSQELTVESMHDKCQLAARCELELATLYSRQLQLVVECEQQLIVEHERRVYLAAEHERQEQLAIVSIVSNIASQTAYFASIIQALLEIGKPEIIVLGCVDAVTFSEGIGGHSSSAQFPSATFENMLSNTALVRLQIEDWALVCVENAFHDSSSLSKPSFSLQMLRLPLEPHLNSGITLPTLRSIARHFPKLLELQTRIIPSVHQPFTFDLDENIICHGLDTLSVSGGCLVEEDKVAVVTYMWSLFPHLKSIVTHDPHDAEDWRYVHRLIEAFQKVRAMEHKLCQHT